MEKFNIPTPVTWDTANKAFSKKKNSNIIIGVLALQGDFLEHIQALERIGVAAKEVRLPVDLEHINGIIIPGGESTTMARLLIVFNLREPLIQMLKQGMPVWGTCAGMILLAKKLVQDKPEPLGVMDIVANRNAFGRQIDSFEAEIQIKHLGGDALHADFIRAPKIEKVGPNVEVLATLTGGQAIAVKEKKMLATSFHPELGMDTRFLEYFMDIVRKSKFRV